MLENKLGAILKGYRVRRSLFNVKEVREQMVRACVLDKLFKERLVERSELLNCRQELAEMVSFLQSGNLEWLKQGGHACVMSDRTFLVFEQECLYEKMRASIATNYDGASDNKLAEHSLCVYNKK